MPSLQMCTSIRTGQPTSTPQSTLYSISPSKAISAKRSSLSGLDYVALVEIHSVCIVNAVILCDDTIRV